MKQTFSGILAAFIFTLSLVACKKGDDGPAGPAGPAGPTGPAGSPNVQYTDWFTPNPYTKDTVFGIWGFKYSKDVAAITQNVLDSGTVLTFGKLLGYNVSIWPVNQVSPLPISLTYISGQTMTDTWSALATPGSIRIRFVNDKNYWSSISTSHQFRVIVIPGGVKLGKVPLNDYSAVCKALNIQE